MSEFRASPEIVSELDEAISWYEHKSPQTAQRFIAAVETAIKDICDRPEQFPRKSSRYWYARVKKFPHIVAFSVRAGVVTIAAIRHTARQNSDLDD